MRWFYHGLCLILATHLLCALPEPAVIQRALDVRVERDWNQSIIIGWVSPQGAKVMRSGTLREDDARKPTPDTVYALGNVTSVLTVAAAAVLVEQKQTSWDSRAGAFLPQGVLPKLGNQRDIQLKHLATHSAGLPLLPYNFQPASPENPYANYSEVELYGFLQQHALLGVQPGSTYQFSMTGTGLLGQLLSLRTRQPYELMLKETLLEPLGMTATTVTLDAVDKSQIAYGHEGETPVPDWQFDALAGASGAHASMRDLLTFLRTCLGHRASTLTPALTRLQVPVLPTPKDDTWVAFGWHVTTREGRDFYWASGLTSGHAAFIGMEPATQTGVAVLSNSSTSIDDLGFATLAPDLFPLPQPQPLLRVSENQLQRLPGLYETQTGEWINVTRQDERLFVQIGDAPVYRVYPVTPSMFRYASGSARIIFGDGQGPAAALVIRSGQKATTANRIN